MAQAAMRESKKGPLLPRCMGLGVEAAKSTTSGKSNHQDRQVTRNRGETVRVIQNFMRRAMKGAYPDKGTYLYFREDEGTASGFGGTSLQLPALGVIVVNRERFRKIQTSVCASQCGIFQPAGLQLRMEYSWAYAEESQTRR